jgi:hypothetical protein
MRAGRAGVLAAAKIRKNRDENNKKSDKEI